MKKILFTLFFILLTTCSYAVSLHPPVTNVFGGPGAEYDGIYTINNTDDTDIRVFIKVSLGNCFSENKDLDAEKILVFDKKEYDVRAGEKIEIPYKVFIGENFKGSVAIRVEFKTERTSGQMISMLMSVPLYITVLGTENVDFDIESIDLQTLNKTIQYKMVVKNKGNVHIRHSGSIDLYYKNKKNLVKTIEIPETVPTYCESSREFIENLIPVDGLLKGKYIAVFKINALEKEVQKEIKFKVDKDGNFVSEQKK